MLGEGVALEELRAALVAGLAEALQAGGEDRPIDGALDLLLAGFRFRLDRVG